ncbi:mixed lineage kinase domain-like protein [Asterias rubens]|uniref:mixed lineage kinase domain-like protein n=1 Tax=Asterias rubens TaxID=7604 RepID=UPI001455CA48|nr:mixed lineage kinase domain-like protein [Asterias rubens]
MEFIEPASMVLTVILEINNIVSKVQSFKHRSQTLAKRITILEPAIKKLVNSENNAIVGSVARDEKGLKLFSQALGDLLKLVQGIRDFLGTLTEKSFLRKLRYANKIGNQFDEFSGQLDALVKDIHFNLHVEMREVSFDRLKEDREDHEKDLQHLLDIIEKLEGLQLGQEEIIEILKKKLSEKPGNCFDHGLDGGPKEIDLSRLENRELLTKGFTGTVYKASYMKETVALKVFPEGANLNKGVLLQEVKNLIRLSSIHVVRIWGVSTTIEPMIVMEYMERGNLRHVLDTTDASLLPIHRRIQMALDGALGLYCIHHMDRAMLHLDLSSHRFLVNAKWEVKISDVGMAKTYTSIRRQSKLTRPTSNMHYVSPEHIKDVNLAPNEPMEVYSYGIIMWEIASGLRPYEGKNDTEVTTFVMQKKKLAFPSHVTNEGLKELIDKCRSFHPLDRPTSSEIVDTLKGLRSALEKSNDIWWE